MSLVLQDRVRETTNTTGTGTFTLLGAVTGYQSFSVIGNGNTCFYACADQGGPNWEVGLGTYSSGTLARTTVLSSSNSGALVNFTAGTKDVFVTQPSEKAVYTDSSGNVSALGTISSGTWNASTIVTAYGGTGLTTYTAGDLPYYASGTALSKLGIGTNGYILQSNGTAPTWVAASSVVGGAGGSNTQVQYNSSGSLAGSANFVFDGTNVGIGTSSPATRLDVRSATTGSVNLINASTTQGSTAGASTILLGALNTSYGSSISSIFNYSAALSTSLAFSTSTSGGTLTEAMRIDSSGNVGIGTSSPSTYGKFVVVTGTDKDGANIVFATAPTGTNGGSLNFWNYTNTAIVKQGMIETICTDGSSSYSSSITFSAAKSGTLTEAMRIDSSGNLLIGETALYQAGGVSISKLGNGANSSGNILFNSAGTANYPALFQYNGSNVGYITYTNTIVQYVSLSDYRLKENITPMIGALETIAKLKPVTYDWKTDGSSGQGFIAHELAQVVPNCVNGEKDAVDEDGKPKYQGIDTSFLVATLTAAIQEQQALITTLQTQVAALQAKVGA